ncbi:protein fam227b-like [Plakobranchus ocellatus]|uniref:Protein fam227b-like n=1 Tax=Plakobranchus ocellatus TaxID=259542 RepID=A0AAV4CKN7_9GAST|nr:protein fam227b-like [Plakobranchus ocellatus]
MDATTYKDVIGESSKNIRKIKKNFQDMYKTNLRHSQKFMQEQQELLRVHMRKQSALLANKKEVKRLSDLIIMEQRKSEGSVSAGADLAVEAALMAQE